MLQQKVLCFDNISCETDLKTADAHLKTVMFTEKNIVRDDVELQWCHIHKTKYGRTNIHDEERSGQPYEQLKEILRKTLA